MPYLGLITVLVMIVALVDIVGGDESAIRGLPRSAWILLVVAVPLAGAVVWLVAGRPRAAFSGRVGDGVDDPTPGKSDGPDPVDEAEFRRRVRERAEEQRRRAETEPRDQES